MKIRCLLLGHDYTYGWKWFDHYNKHLKALYCKRCSTFIKFKKVR